MPYTEHSQREIHGIQMAHSTLESGDQRVWCGYGGLEGRWLTVAQFRELVGAMREFADSLPPEPKEEALRVAGAAGPLGDLEINPPMPSESPHGPPHAGIRAALDAPGAERLRDFYEVGPAQRAAVESFVDALGAVRASGFDLEAMLAACVPGGSICDPQQIADAIRDYFAAGVSACDAPQQKGGA